MSITFQQAEKIDTILNPLISYNSSKGFLIRDIAMNLKIEFDEMDFLIGRLKEEIRFENNEVLSFSIREYPYPTLTQKDLRPDFFKLLIFENYNTKRFIDSGGCVAWYNKKLQEQQKEEERKFLEDQKLKAELKEFRLKKWQFWLTFGIAIVGLVLSIVSLIINADS